MKLNKIFDFNDIIKKYNYNYDLAVFLKQVYDFFVSYLGDSFEPIIYASFLEVPIINCSNIYDYLQVNNLLEENNNTNVLEILTRASGLNFSKVYLDYDPTTNTYKIKEIKRMLLVSDFDLRVEHKKACLIHELFHSIKSHLNCYIIKGDILITRSGFNVKKEKLKYEAGKVKTEIIEELGRGFDEGLTAILEEEIVQKVINPKYEVQDYNLIKETIKKVLLEFNLKSSVIEPQLLGNIATFIKEFNNSYGPNSYENLISSLDKIYFLSLKLNKEILSGKNYKQAYFELNKCIKEYLKIINNINDYKKTKNEGSVKNARNS